MSAKLVLLCTGYTLLATCKCQQVQRMELTNSSGFVNVQMKGDSMTYNSYEWLFKPPNEDFAFLILNFYWIIYDGRVDTITLPGEKIISHTKKPMAYMQNFVSKYTISENRDDCCERKLEESYYPNAMTYSSVSAPLRLAVKKELPTNVDRPGDTTLTFSYTFLYCPAVRCLETRTTTATLKFASIRELNTKLIVWIAVLGALFLGAIVFIVILLLKCRYKGRLDRNEQISVELSENDLDDNLEGYEDMTAASSPIRTESIYDTPCEAETCYSCEELQYQNIYSTHPQSSFK